MTFCSTRNIFVNIVLMCILWTCSSFDYYLITFFLKYIPGNIFVNTSIASFSEVVAYIISGYLMNLMGIKVSYFVGFAVAATGGLLMIFFFHLKSMIAVFVLLSKFGISFAFNVSYLGTPKLFPVALTGTAFGICNVFARFSTVLSAPIAEFTVPLPMLIFTTCCIIGAILSPFLRSPPPEAKVEEDVKS